MYSNLAVSRPEISAVLEQAQGLDKFYIAQKVFPIHGVTARAGRYPRIDVAKGALMKREQTKRSSTGAYNETSQEHEWDTYDCEDRGLEQRIDDTKAKEMKTFFDLEKLEAKNVRRKCLLDFEINAASKLMDEANFPHEHAVVAYTEANIATIDFPQDINAAIELVTGRGEDVNTIVFSHTMWNRLRRSTMLQQYLYGKLGPDTQKRLITPKDLAEAFSLDLEGSALQVLVARAKYDTAPKGRTTSTLVPIWGNSYVWVGCCKGGDYSEGGAGRTLVWEADIPSGLYATETYRDEKRRSDMVRVRTNSIEKVLNGNAGQLVVSGWA
jgi:hypothetical protein